LSLNSTDPYKKISRQAALSGRVQRLRFLANHRLFVSALTLSSTKTQLQVNRNCDCRSKNASLQEERSQSCLLVNLGMSAYSISWQKPLKSTSEEFNICFKRLTETQQLQSKDRHRYYPSSRFYPTCRRAWCVICASPLGELLYRCEVQGVQR
jgi:hypothetical protein